MARRRNTVAEATNRQGERARRNYKATQMRYFLLVVLAKPRNGEATAVRVCLTRGIGKGGGINDVCGVSMLKQQHLKAVDFRAKVLRVNECEVERVGELKYLLGSGSCRRC